MILPGILEQVNSAIISLLDKYDTDTDEIWYVAVDSSNRVIASANTGANSTPQDQYVHFYDTNGNITKTEIVPKFSDADGLRYKGCAIDELNNLLFWTYKTKSKVRIYPYDPNNQTVGSEISYLDFSETNPSLGVQTITLIEQERLLFSGERANSGGVFALRYKSDGSSYTSSCWTFGEDSTKSPHGVATDSHNRLLFVADNKFVLCYRFSPDGQLQHRSTLDTDDTSTSIDFIDLSIDTANQLVFVGNRNYSNGTVYVISYTVDGVLSDSGNRYSNSDQDAIICDPSRQILYITNKAIEYDSTGGQISSQNRVSLNGTNTGGGLRFLSRIDIVNNILIATDHRGGTKLLPGMDISQKNTLPSYATPVSYSYADLESYLLSFSNPLLTLIGDNGNIQTSNGKVSRWIDVSGNGYDFIPIQASTNMISYGERNLGVRFFNQDYLKKESGGYILPADETNMTALIVYQSFNNTGGNYTFDQGFNSGNELCFGRTASGSDFLINCPNNNNSDAFTGSSSYPARSFRIGGGRVIANTERTAFIDDWASTNGIVSNTEPDTTPALNTSYISDSGYNCALGGQAKGLDSDRYLNGVVYCVAAWGSSLSNSQIGDIYSKLFRYYGFDLS